MVVLVGYASTHGSTGQIAERIAAGLGERGIRADARSLDQVQDAAGYDGFVLGSAVYGGAWLREATEFVRGNLDVLADRPVWLFSVGAMVARHGRLAVFRREPKEIASFRESIHPRDYRSFFGVVRREHISFIGHLIFKGTGGRYGDFRDWTQIDAWTDDIARALTA